MCLIAKSLCMLHAIDVKLSTNGDTITFSHQYAQPTTCTGPHTYFTGGGEGAPICDMFPSPPIVP